MTKQPDPRNMSTPADEPAVSKQDTDAAIAQKAQEFGEPPLEPSTAGTLRADFGKEPAHNWGKTIRAAREAGARNEIE